jgi:triacylglycerol lipase
MESVQPIFPEALIGIEILLLHAAPVYYGAGVPRGDDSGVLLIPGFLGSDVYLFELYAWLQRIGYRPYYSGIGVNAECPNLLIRRSLNETIERAWRETGRKLHVLGHSLGGLLARAVAGDMPDRIASVITLASPFRGTVLNPRVAQAVEAVRQRILLHGGDNVLPDCYTGRCTCSFLQCLKRDVTNSVAETAIYSRTDGFVDWRYCVTGQPENDFEVTGTHLGLTFNPSVYSIVAKRLAASTSR